MATGTTFNSGFRRDEIIAAALKKVTKSRKGGYSLIQIDDAIKSLNKIIRSESARGDSRVDHLWALQETALILTPGVYQYGLAHNTLNIKSMVYRGIDGRDCPIHLITHVQWNQLTNKVEEGSVKQAYFKNDIDLEEQVLYVNPVPLTVTAGSEVLGTDGLNYTCIQKHTAAAVNRPITGEGYGLYWQLEGSAGAAWVTGTEYVNGELLYYVYERPLFDFDLPGDNPDMPAGWENYLIYKLAYDLAPDYRLPLEERKFLEYRVTQELGLLHPSKKVTVTDHHNKGSFF